VAVQNGGHPARAALAAGGALAELGARLSGDMYLGHGDSSYDRDGCSDRIDRSSSGPDTRSP
jgi:hypothetical protein